MLKVSMKKKTSVLVTPATNYSISKQLIDHIREKPTVCEYTDKRRSYPFYFKYRYYTGTSKKSTQKKSVGYETREEAEKAVEELWNSNRFTSNKRKLNYESITPDVSKVVTIKKGLFKYIKCF